MRHGIVAPMNKLKMNADVALAQSGQHTPGPWAIESGGLNRYVVEESTGNVLASLNYPSHRDIDNERANARLIAAAPELLQALELAKATIERLHRHAPNSAKGTLDVVSSAIAKAQGTL